MESHQRNNSDASRGGEDNEPDNTLILFVTVGLIFIIGTYKSGGGTVESFFESPWSNAYTSAIEGLNAVVLFGEPAISVPFWLVLFAELFIVKLILEI